VIGDLLGPTDRAEENGVVRADLAPPILRHHGPVSGIIVVRREIERIQTEIKAVFLGGRFEHGAAFRHHLLADSIACDDGDLEMIALVAIGHSILVSLTPCC
jgi:hypothetical protein